MNFCKNKLSKSSLLRKNKQKRNHRCLKDLLRYSGRFLLDVKLCIGIKLVWLFWIRFSVDCISIILRL